MLSATLPPFLVPGTETAVASYRHGGETSLWFSPGTGAVVRTLIRCRFGRRWLAHAARMPLQALARRTRVAWRGAVGDWLRGVGLARAPRLVAQRGSRGLYRKYVALGINDDGAPAWVLKCSDAPDSRVSMAAEAQALAQVAELMGDGCRVPRFYGSASADGLYLTAQEACVPPGTAVVRAWTPAHHRFCARLGRAARAEPHRLWTQALGLRERLRQQLGRRPAGAAVSATCGDLITHALARVDADRVPLGWAHRDFTPWNAFAEGDRLTVVDWEWADPAWAPLHDCFHFHWFPRLLSRDLAPQDWLALRAPGGAAAALATDLALPGELSAYAALYLYDTLLFYACAVEREGRDPSADALLGRVDRAARRLLERWRREEIAA